MAKLGYFPEVTEVTEVINVTFFNALLIKKSYVNDLSHLSNLSFSHAGRPEKVFFYPRQSLFPQSKRK